MANAFDYIVVGAGSAGCVVVSRLTEDPGTQVLLLEAGVSDKDPSLQRALRIPKYFQFMQKSVADWDYNTEPVPGMANRSIYCPRGRILGGTSTFIAGLVVRGNRRNFAEWAELAGDDSWRYESLLPYFKRLERNTRPDIGEMHGTDGEMTVSDIKLHPATRAFFSAAKDLGYDRIDDFNDWEQEGGTSPYQMYEQRGIRVNSANSYLRDEVRRRPNLTIEIQAEACRILFDGNRAAGVEYDRAGVGGLTASARREVIVCGGAINSPKLLMLSGVGPAAQLQRLGIPVVCDLPGVGQNFQNHPIAGVIYSYKRGTQPPGSDAAGIEGGLFVRIRDDLVAPDLQMVFNSGVVGPPQTVPDWTKFALVGALVKPESRGHLELRAEDPAGKPRIFPNYLSEPGEMALMVEAIRMARRVIAAPAFDGLRGEELFPGPKVQSDTEIAAYVGQTAGTLFHPAGTCKMGASPRDGAVVDSQLRVFGLQGLRVVDASIMPVITTGNTHTPTTMIGEKASEMIRNAAKGAGTAAGAGVFYRRSRYTVRDRAVAQVRSAAREYIDYVRMNETGTQRYAIVESRDRSGEFVHIAEFIDRQAFEASQSSSAYQKLVAVLRPSLQGDVESETVEGSLVAADGIAQRSESDFIVRVWVTVKDRRHLRRFRELIQELYDLRWQRKGLLEWEVYCDPQNDLCYLFSERWVSEEAQQIHTANYQELMSLIRSDVLQPFHSC
ncbi:MAG: GMC family oxidoreductase N-terminal domain-containing protein [Thermoanaerobaculia bacterium]